MNIERRILLRKYDEAAERMLRLLNQDLITHVELSGLLITFRTNLHFWGFPANVPARVVSRNDSNTWYTAEEIFDAYQGAEGKTSCLACKMELLYRCHQDFNLQANDPNASDSLKRFVRDMKELWDNPEVQIDNP